MIGHGGPGCAVQPEPRGHIGKERPAQCGGEIGHRRACRRIRQPASHQKAARTARHQLRHLSQQLRSGAGRRTLVTGVGVFRIVPRAHRLQVRVEVLPLPRGGQGLAEHAVDMDCPARRATATAHRLVHRGQHHRRIDAGGRTRESRRPLRVAAEELDLVHGLVGAGVLQLRRAVAAQHQQRHPLQRRLHHRRPHVGQGTAGGGEDHGRHPGRPPVPQGMEGRAALVVVDDAPGSDVARDRHHQRRAAGARSHAERIDPVANELLDQQRRPQMVDVGGLQVTHRGRFRAWVKWLIL